MRKYYCLIPVLILITVLSFNGKVYADGAEPPAAPEEPAVVESTPAETTDPGGPGPFGTGRPGGNA